ncbi:Kelch repeat-containing protein [Thalassotalea sp. PLHSN55]|uniref:Kelch repeat-containing protein n=1 Tax=Thalassotalea sp. PLHSN55 TaxID=3435888 RepID=UPI003F86D671
MKTILGCITLILSLAANAQWQMIETQNAATPRHENGFVAHNKTLYLIGGRGDKPVEQFDIAQRSWLKKANTPLEMHHITPVSFGESIFVVTGLTGKYPVESPLAYVYQYQPKTDTWSMPFEIPLERRRGGAGVVVHNDKIYIVGGITNGHTSGTSKLFDVYDPKNNTWHVLTDAPNIRDHANAVILSGKLLALGGRNTSYHEPDNFTAFMDKVSNKVDVYNFDKKAWHTLDVNLPVPTGGGGAAVLNNTLYYTGGETGALPANHKTVSFSFNNMRWQDEAPLNRGRHGSNLVVVDNKLYIAAGSGQRGGKPELSSIEVFQKGVKK